ncbi:Chromate resistance protein ChrB [Haloechinothrix halophila]|uniref:Chromate resistance protein ChrB n=1 Tax=Haloechinothrix halophila TaxID=1069073 RepID=UPI0003F546F8|nr:Chromate resistance protein ChrB [Haloechinothrix halophila]
MWRKLKRLGVAQLADGVVALPADARTREYLEWLADEIIEGGGTAGIWIARPASLAQERELASSMAEARAAEYRALAEEATPVADLTENARLSAARRLRAELRRITRRDYSPHLSMNGRAARSRRCCIPPQPTLPRRADRRSGPPATTSTSTGPPVPD